MWSALINGALALLLALINRREAEGATKQRGRDEAVLETSRVIVEVADAQAENNAHFRNLDSAIARLQREVAAADARVGNQRNP